MKTILITSFLLIYFVGYGQNKTEILPKKSVVKTILSGKEDYTYYMLSEKSKTEYIVSGPGKLTLNFRVRIESNQLKSKPFGVRYIQSLKKMKTIDIPELLAGNLTFKSATTKGSPTKLHKVEINVPPGKHTYEFYEHKTEQKVNMRAFYMAGSKPLFQDLNPTSKLQKKQVRFIKSGVNRTYYRITKQDGFKFSVPDSTYLRIIVRPEFSYKMLEETCLKLELKNLTTGLSKVYKVNSKKSSNSEFVSDKQTVPGRASTFYINLNRPKSSRDIYSMKMISGAKAAVVRISQDKMLLK